MGSNTIYVLSISGRCVRIGSEQHGQVPGAMQYPLDSHRAIEYPKENHIAVQSRHTQAGGQVLAADIAHGCAAYALACLDQPGDKASCIRPAVFGNVVADVE